MKNNTESGASEPADDVSGSSTSTEVRRPVSLADEDALDAFVADADAAVIEFYTDGCGICASMEPVLGNVARELDLAVATVNPRDDPPLVERFDVRSVPLFVAVRRRRAGRTPRGGFIPGDDLTAWITDHVA